MVSIDYKESKEDNENLEKKLLHPYDSSPESINVTGEFPNEISRRDASERDVLSGADISHPEKSKSDPNTATSPSDGITSSAPYSGPSKPSNLHSRTVSWGMGPNLLTVNNKPSSVSRSRTYNGNPSLDTNRWINGTHVTKISTDTQTKTTSPDLRDGLKPALSLLDLMKESPFESEAEAYIQRTLDEVDPTKPGWSDAQKGLLGQIPATVPPERFEPETVDVPNNHLSPTSAAPSSVTEKNSTSKKKAVKKPQSTMENLFELAMDLKEMHHADGNLHSNSNHKKHKNPDSALPFQPRNDADQLARNAAKLMRRHTIVAKEGRAGKPVGESESDVDGADAEAHVKVSAADRWKKVRTTLKTADAIQNSRSNKEQDKDKSEEESIEMSSLHGNGKRNYRRVAMMKVATEFKDFEDWLVYRKIGLFTYIKLVLFGLIIPMSGIAAILFYLVGNPPCGTTSQCLKSGYNVTQNTTNILTSETLKSLLVTASTSWWLLFAVRQAITLSLARASEKIWIEYFGLRSRWSLALLGPFVTLFLVQAGGWPFMLFCWGVVDFVTLFGKNRFAHHWLFYQDYIGLFNERNPSGVVTESREYRLLLILAVVISFVVALKRFFLGLYLGKQTYCRYADELAKVMKKALMIGKVSNLAREIEQQIMEKQLVGLDRKLFDLDETTSSVDEDKEVNSDVLEGLERSSEMKIQITQLLGEWEEPETEAQKEEAATIGAIIQFRQSLSYLNTAYPFGVAFGPATTRSECIQSTQQVYGRLMLKAPNAESLSFNTMALLAVNDEGDLDVDLVKSLIRLFRPDRDGKLSLLDFAKSVDAAYKELRLLRASVASSSKMDQAFGTIINIAFYFLVTCIVLASLGVDPLVLFASVSSFFVGFAFMIGAACSKYFEGLLLILVRRPYDIGDRIHVSSVNVDTSSTGSSGWVVKDVNLFTTTVIYGATNEVATYSNGSLAAFRIINGARSPKASISFLFKFPIDTSYERIQVFKKGIEQFVQARPREWIAFLAFRTTRVEADLGFVEYVCAAQHRDSWQQVGNLLTSKAELSSFALELMKKMNMRYTAPPMPVDLTVKHNSSGWALQVPDLEPNANPTHRSRAGTTEFGSADMNAVSALFNH